MYCRKHMSYKDLKKASGGGTYCDYHKKELCRVVKPHCKICGADLCPECYSDDLNRVVGVPEWKHQSLIAICRNCGKRIKHSDFYGDSIFG
jgi:hypothetical protein